MNQSKAEAKRGKSGPWIITITLMAALAVSYYQWNRHSAQMERYEAVMETYRRPSSKGIKYSNLILIEAINEFELKNYEDSNKILEDIKPKTDQVYWYLGHIALINGQVYKAKNHANKIKNSELQKDIFKYVNEII